MKRQKKHIQGMALAITICFIFLILVMGVAFINTMGLKYKSSGDYEAALKALYASDSAYRIAIKNLFDNRNSMIPEANGMAYLGSYGIAETTMQNTGNAVVTYRVYKDTTPPTFNDPDSSPNPKSWYDATGTLNYQICLCCEGKYANSSTILGIRTIGMQVLITPSDGNPATGVYVLRWYEKYK